MSLKKFDHVILTRFNTLLVNDRLLYDNPGQADWWMDRRMPLFEETKKSVLSQDGDFKWIISLDSRTPERYVSRIETDERILVTKQAIQHALEGYIPSSDWVISSRLDCDDRYLPGFTDMLYSHFEPKIKVIDANYIKLSYKSNKVFRHERMHPASMFVSLVEPAERFVGAFCRPHGQLTEYPISGTFGNFGKRVRIPYDKDLGAYMLMVCHDLNATNHIDVNLDEYFCELGELNDKLNLMR